MVRTDPRAVATLEAHLAYVRFLTEAGGGGVVDGGGIVIYRSTTPLPFLVNGAARTDPSVPPEGVVDAVRGHFGPRGFEILCLEGRDDDLGAAAENAGLRIGSPDPLQYLDRPPRPGPADRSALEVRPVTDASGVRDLAEVCEDAHFAYGSLFPKGTFQGILGEPAVLAPAIDAVVVYEHGAPVATAQVFAHGELAYVGWVAVARTAMRRGFGWLTTEEVVTRSFERGAKSAVLLASPMGAPLYRQLGFVDVGNLKNAYSRGVAG